VPEDVLDLLQRDALTPEQRGAGVPEVVEADPAYPARCAQLVEVPAPSDSRRHDAPKPGTDVQVLRGRPEEVGLHA
jgi:hypothetical protein